MRTKLGDIIEGHVNEALGNNRVISQERLEICLKCPICKSTSIGLMCDSDKWIDKEDKSEDFEFPGSTRGCGCRLSAKTTLPEAKCIVDKW